MDHIVVGAGFLTASSLTNAYTLYSIAHSWRNVFLGVLSHTFLLLALILRTCALFLYASKPQVLLVLANWTLALSYLLSTVYYVSVFKVTSVSSKFWTAFRCTVLQMICAFVVFVLVGGLFVKDILYTTESDRSNPFYVYSMLVPLGVVFNALLAIVVSVHLTRELSAMALDVSGSQREEAKQDIRKCRFVLILYITVTLVQLLSYFATLYFKRKTDDGMLLYFVSISNG
ncbi:hypothetical protein EDD86DRAFT_248455 [Gorgonomyces haynaldii]|nr:hypothetical protein EDD86DRAFT_248455 [Gorgonomyces haynaldii]